MPHVELNTQTIFYAEHRAPGSAIPPVLLIHGAGGQHANWPPQVRRMDAVHTITPDLPGHGRSGGTGRRTIGEYATDMLALADALDMERFIPVGHSMGGAIALQLALDAPERVAGLGLVSTGARLRVTPRILDHVLDDYEKVVDFVVRAAFGPTADDDLRRLGRRLLMEAPPEVVLRDYLACDAFDVRERLGEVAAPALVIGGTADRMTPPEFSSYLAEHIPDAELHLIEGAGHMIAAEFPDWVADILWNWLARQWEL